MSTENAAYHVRYLADEILQDRSYQLLEPLSHSGLSLVPIVMNADIDETMEYINAAEAFESETLIITEGGDQVNTLIAKNIGNIPILIEEGEVLIGIGSQDRIVVASVILQPEEDRRIPVKCVHEPHFLRTGASFHSIGAGGADLRASLKEMKYESIMTDVVNYCAESVVDQGEVWDKVEDYCRKLGIEDQTKYTDAIAKIKETVSDLANEIRNQLPLKTCGIIVISPEGKVIAMELYRNKQAFRKRAGFLESMLMEFSNLDKKSIEREAAWSKAVQLLLQMKDIKDEDVIAKAETQSVLIGLGDLRGEAILQKNVEDKRNITLYCSLS